MIDNKVYVVVYKLQSKLSTSDILIDLVRCRRGKLEFLNTELSYSPYSSYVTLISYHLIDSWEMFTDVKP